MTTSRMTLTWKTRMYSRSASLSSHDALAKRKDQNEGLDLGNPKSPPTPGDTERRLACKQNRDDTQQETDGMNTSVSQLEGGVLRWRGDHAIDQA